MFHVYILKKCIGYPVSILLLKCLGVNDIFPNEEVPVKILDHQDMNLRDKEVSSVKFLWRNHIVEGST